eukprot:5347189-Lingulodinium_polyedra.AAC.1
MDIDHVDGPGAGPRQRARDLRAWRERYRLGLETEPAIGKPQFGNNVVVVFFTMTSTAPRMTTAMAT